MSEYINFTQTQRALVRLIYKMIIINPFGEEIIALNRELASDRANLTRNDIAELYIEKIDALFHAFDQKLGRPAILADFQESDRHEIYYLICCRVYHIYREKFDLLTQQQMKNPDSLITVDFAGELIQQLTERGVEKEIPLVMGYMYQLRRAWHFISTNLAGTGTSLQRLRRDLWNNIFTHSVEIYERKLWYRMENFSTLLLGPTGSGKGAAAAAIGYSSFIPYDIANKRFTESFTSNFISVNLSQYPETLLESELFGHARGAFTGAIDQYDGLFGRCGQYGTIFLDEIGELKQHTQVKILKVLEERTYNRLGSHETLRFHGRVLAATHRQIDILRQQYGFRDDLYYRLCSDVIYVPSLRQRLEENPNELPILVNHLLNNFLSRPDEQLAKKITGQLLADIPSGYTWPGNVRELAQLVRRVILRNNCQQPIASASETNTETTDTCQECTVAELTESHCKKLYAKYQSYSEVAAITGLDWRTVKKVVGN